MTDNISHQKNMAVQFLQLVVAGQIEEAYRKFVNMNGKHHNPFFPAGFPALKKGMEENHNQFPDKQLMVKHILGDGDTVAVHSRLVMGKGERDLSVVHIFRFRGDKIEEMWDCGQFVPTDSPNKDGAF